MGIGKALWTTARETVELRETPFETGAEMVEVEAMFGGISRGTEQLVFRGEVPESEWARMRCPLQEGDFPFPVKYGYATVGAVRTGPVDLIGRTVFVLHPHQDRFAAPEAMAIPLPDGLPAARAVLAANMETALTIVWDSGAGPGDRVAVIGAGVVGALAGYLCARLPGSEVTLVDVNPERAGLAEALGCGFALRENCPDDCDVVIHASATWAGLATAIGAAGFEATVVEASWHGARPVEVPLGGAFHSRRLRLLSSQVGHVPPERRARWTNRRRMETALALLADARLDALISGETRFADLASRYGAILADPATLCHRIVY